MQYYKIYFDESFKIIIMNDIFRAKEMLGERFVKLEPYRNWRYSNPDFNDFETWNSNVYYQWKKDQNKNV